jgi:parallel beta-helix repeat protein
VIADSATSGVTIEGFTMRHAATGVNDGAIHNGLAANSVEGGSQSVGDDGNAPRYPNWTVRGNTLLSSHSAGVSLAGTNYPSCDWTSGQGLVIDKNTSMSSGDFGIHSSCSQGTQVTGNTASSNGGTPIGGVIDPGFDPKWGAGGFKSSEQNGMIVLDWALWRLDSLPPCAVCEHSR